MSAVRAAVARDSLPQASAPPLSVAQISRLKALVVAIQEHTPTSPRSAADVGTDWDRLAQAVARLRATIEGNASVLGPLRRVTSVEHTLAQLCGCVCQPGCQIEPVAARVATVAFEIMVRVDVLVCVCVCVCVRLHTRKRAPPFHAREFRGMVDFLSPSTSTLTSLGWLSSCAAKQTQLLRDDRDLTDTHAYLTKGGVLGTVGRLLLLLASTREHQEALVGPAEAACRFAVAAIQQGASREVLAESNLGKGECWLWQTAHVPACLLGRFL